MKRAPRYKKKRMLKRRFRKPGVRRPMRNRYGGIKMYKETAAGIPINMPAGGGVGATLAVKLQANFADITNAVPDGAIVGTRDSFRSLYSRYCIVGVKYKFVPTFTSADASGNRPADRVVYAVNRDPNGVVNDELDVLRQNDAKFTNTNRGFTIYVKHPEPILYSSAGTAGIQADAPPIVPGALNQVAATQGNLRKWTWLPTRINPDLQQHPEHVGADIFITGINPAAGAYQAYTMFKTIYVAFKEQD